MMVERQQQQATIAWQRVRPQQQRQLARQLQALQHLVWKRSARLAQLSWNGTHGPVFHPLVHPTAGDGADAGPLSPRGYQLLRMQNEEAPRTTPSLWHVGEQTEGQPQVGPEQSPQQPRLPSQQQQIAAQLQRVLPQICAGDEPHARGCFKAQRGGVAFESPGGRAAGPQSWPACHPTEGPASLARLQLQKSEPPHVQEWGLPGPPRQPRWHQCGRAQHLQLPQQLCAQHTPSHFTHHEAQSLGSTEEGGTASASSGSEQDSPTTTTARICRSTRSEHQSETLEAMERPQQQHRQPLQHSLRPPPGLGARRCPSLRDALQCLHELHDDSRILALRRVRQMGAQAESLLEEHFGHSGRVERVLTYTVYKGSGGKSARLGDLAFVLMAAKSEATRVLEAGTVCIAENIIEVGPFQSATASPPQ